MHATGANTKSDDVMREKSKSAAVGEHWQARTLDLGFGSNSVRGKWGVSRR